MKDNNPFNSLIQASNITSHFNDFINDYSQEEKESPLAQSHQSYSSQDTIKEMIRDRADMLSRQYIKGIRASRVVDSNIIISAPRGYFNRYHSIVKKAVSFVQTFMSTSSNLSSIVNKAKNNPTNEDFQEDAWDLVYKGMLEYYENNGGGTLDAIEKMIVNQFVNDEIIGFSVIDPLWRDKKLTEIICNGPYDIQFELKGSMYKAESISFRDGDHLQNLIDRIYASINRTVSPIRPLRKGRLPDRSRLMAIHRTIAPEGPNFQIRRHPEEYWVPTDLISYHSASEELLTDIGNLIYKGCSFILSGGTSTGKTSTLNALTGFYRNNLRLLSLEDNLELKPNPNKLWAAAMECNEDITEDGTKIGVSMRDLVKASLQMRPNGIIIGEVTDGSMYDLCQALNTGHFGASTVHANDTNSAIQKIISLVSQAELIQGDAILPIITSAFDFIIQLEHSPIDGSRRIVEVSEILPDLSFNEAGDPVIVTQPLWKFVHDGVITKDSKPIVTGHWEKVGELSRKRSLMKNLSLTDNLSWEELVELSSIHNGTTVTQAGNI